MTKRLGVVLVLGLALLSAGTGFAVASIAHHHHHQVSCLTIKDLGRHGCVPPLGFIPPTSHPSS